MFTCEMKVIEHLKNATKPLLNFEITPPERGGDIDKDLEVVSNLKKYNPSFIHVTSRAADSERKEIEPGVYEEKIRRKRPGTLGLCTRINFEHKIDTVCHVVCKGFDQQETEDFLIELDYGKMRNILAIQGDENSYQKPLKPGRSINKYASDLIKQISDMNQGRYLEDLLDARPTDFCIGGACYPEKHYMSPNPEKDMEVLKIKIDSGMQYAISQMFFDNNKYFDFVESCRKNGITIPIIPGITTLVSKKQLEGPKGIPAKFHCLIPPSLSKKIEEAEKEDVKKIAIDWTTKQAQELINQGVPSVHFFIYGNSNSIIEAVDNLRFFP